ncbi:MAG: KilA-N domain-containing protein [Bacteroidota bacterium]
MTIQPENQIFGAYNGVTIRCKRFKDKLLINVTDLKKANNATAKYRFDRWRNSDEVQNYLIKEANKTNVELIKNRNGLIAEAPEILEVISGGSRLFQGTYVCPELAKRYVKIMSEDCFQWLNNRLLEQKSENVVKAKKVNISLGHMNLDVHEIPNGEYRLSQTQAANVIQKDEVSIRDFMGSKSPEALPYKGFTAEKIAVKDSKTRINALPISIVVAFWTKESIKGNKIASRLLGACAVESIERRADKAFGKDVSEEQYNQRFQKNYKSIIANCPKSLIKHEENRLKIAVFEGDARKIKTLYPNGIIPEFQRKERIIERIVYLSSHAVDDAWKLKPRQELSQKGKMRKSKYPDLMSGVIDLNGTKAIFIFQVYEDIIRTQDIDSCISRNYIKISRKIHDIDNSFLFLVSPLGAHKDVALNIQEELEDEENKAYNYIGVATIKELAQFYFEQAISNKNNPRNIGNIKKDFKPFLEYKIFNPLDQAIQLSINFPAAS